MLMRTSHLPVKHTSLWIDTTSKPNFLSMSASSLYDVVIIGAGIVGLTSAYFLTQEGLKVAVIESRKILQGVTGYTTAKVTSQHGLIYKHLIDNFGVEKAQQYADANQTAIQKIRDIVKKHSIECDLLTKNAYTYTDDIKKIEDEVEAAQKLHLPATFEDNTPLPLHIEGSIKFSNQAQFHPTKYLLALAEIIMKKGGSVFEETQFLDMEEGKTCKILTDKGSVKAKHVIIASNYPVYDKAMYFSRLTPKRSYVLAVTLAGKAPEGMFYNDFSQIYSFRNQPYKKGELFLIGGQNHTTGETGDERERYKKLEKYARKHFDIKSIEYSWSTHDPVSIDQVPFVGFHTPNSKNVYVASGFGGWGMTNGTVSGILLTDLIMRRKNPWQDVYNPNRFKPVTSTPKITSSVKTVIKNYSEKLLPKKEDNPNDLKEGEGRIMTIKGKKLAMYKDEKGHICPLSAVCTHMGCIVKFNTAEKSWDCPCHGSRFNTDGTVIHGPAIKPLEKKELVIS